MNDSNVSCEAMDVDHSGNSASKMDISYIRDDGQPVIIKSESDEPDFIRPETVNEPVYIKTKLKDNNVHKTIKTSPQLSVENEINMEHGGHIKKYHINICRASKVRNRSKIDVRTKLLVMGLFVIFISVLTHYIINFNCNEELDLEYLKETLSINIFGQSKAVDAIIETLALNVGSKIMFFYGGTGVGKTFATSLIFEKIGKSSNIYHYTMPSFANTFSTEFMLGLTVCKSATMIVDDLTPRDMNIKSHINDIVVKSENLGKNITIILIYNCDNVTGDFIKQCDKSFYAELKENFIDIKAVQKFIKFDSLTEEHLKKCVEKELGYKKVNKLDMDNILKNFNVSLDGCKGVYTKIKFLNIM